MAPTMDTEYTPGWLRPYGTGLMAPWYASGDTDDGDTGDDNQDGDTGDDSGDDDWTPPTREEWEKAQDDKRRSDSEAAARKRYLRKHGIDPKTGEKVGAASDDDDAQDDKGQKDVTSKADIKRATDRAVAQAEARADQRMRGVVVGLYEELNKAGWNGRGLGRIVRLLDFDDIEIDEDGILGLDGQITELKSDFPEMFKRVRSNTAGSGAGGKSGGTVDAADKQRGTDGKQASWAEKVAAAARRG